MNVWDRGPVVVREVDGRAARCDDLGPVRRLPCPTFPLFMRHPDGTEPEHASHWHEIGFADGWAWCPGTMQYHPFVPPGLLLARLGFTVCCFHAGFMCWRPEDHPVHTGWETRIRTLLKGDGE